MLKAKEAILICFYDNTIQGCSQYLNQSLQDFEQNFVDDVITMMLTSLS